MLPKYQHQLTNYKRDKGQQAVESSTLVRILPPASSSNHCQHYFTDWRVVSIAMVSEAAVFEVCCLLLLYGAYRVSARITRIKGM